MANNPQSRNKKGKDYFNVVIRLFVKTSKNYPSPLDKQPSMTNMGFVSHTLTVSQAREGPVLQRFVGMLLSNGLNPRKIYYTNKSPTSLNERAQGRRSPSATTVLQRVGSRLSPATATWGMDKEG